MENMLIPNAENAVVDIRKLRDYCLNPNHKVGKHKARVFASALNLTENNAAELQTALLEAVKVFDAELGRLDEYGQHYTVDFEVEREGKRAVVRSGWIIDADSDVPRLVTYLNVYERNKTFRFGSTIRRFARRKLVARTSRRGGRNL